MAETTLESHPLYGGVEQGQRDVERSDDRRRWAQVPRIVGLWARIRRGCLQSRQRRGCVAERIRVRLNREHPRVARSEIAKLVRRLDQALPGLRSRVRPPRALSHQPEQVQLQFAIAGLGGAAGFRNQCGGPSAIDERARMSNFLDPGRPRPLASVGLQPRYLLQERANRARLSELKSEFRRGQETRDTAIRLAQLGRASQRGERDISGPTSSGTPARILQLHRDLFVRPADQSRAVPDAPVRIGVEGVRQRLVDAAALRCARLLADRRTDERMPKLDGALVERDHRCLDRGLEALEIQRSARHKAPGGEHLAQLVAVVESSDQQEETGAFGQVRDPRGERPLESLAQRRQPGNRRILDAPGDPGQLDQRERVPGRFEQNSIALDLGQPARCPVQKLTC